MNTNELGQDTRENTRDCQGSSRGLLLLVT